MRKLLYEFNKILKQKLFLEGENNILCAISGGQDSIFLFFLLLHFEKRYNLKLTILYCHHFWQPANFTSLWLIWKIAFLFKVPFYMILTEKFIGSENRARKWRQDSYQRISSFLNCNKVILGHTASDRIETAFWHLIRGTGLKGLSSLRWEKPLQNLQLNPAFSDLFCLKKNNNIIKSKKSNKKNSYQNKFLKKKFQIVIKISNFSTTLKPESVSQERKEGYFLSGISTPKNQYYVSGPKSTLFDANCFLVTKRLKIEKKIIRPLLGFHRSDITTLIDSSCFPLLNDSTNQQIKLQRNKIRYQLMPTLRYSFNLKLDYLINQFLEISTEDLALLQNFSRQFFYIQFLKDITPFFFKKLPICVQREIVLRVFVQAQGLILIYSQIEKIRSSINSKNIK
jgi:tRNA(Ile)-lysidine synthetase-like protein